MRRRAALVAITWVVTVAAISSTLWAVIGHVGRRVGPEGSYAGRPQVSWSGTPSSSPTPRRTPTASPRPRPTASPSRSKPAPSVKPAPPPPAPEQPTPRTQTFSSEGGTIVATCTGSTIRVEAVRPRDGWSIGEPEVESGQVEVKFTSGEREDEVSVRCRGGQPVGSD